MITVDSLENAISRIDALNRRFGINIGSVAPSNNRAFAIALDQASDDLAKMEKAGKTSPVAEAVQNPESLAKVDATVSGDVTSRASKSVEELDTLGLIEAAAQRNNVDPRLIEAIIEAESGGNQDVISSAGAVGIMQLMPSTAASLGVNPYDKAENIEGGTKYIRQMLDTFGGDVEKAVAAYNAGPGAVKSYGGIPPYKETQNYVNKVLDIYS